MLRESSKKQTGRRRASPPPDSVTVFSFVGNPGCIRFPEAVRKVSGIKRDDKLVLSVGPDNGVVLEKRDAVTPESLRQSVMTAEVAKCSCPEPPRGCADGEPLIVAVGWSYVHMKEPLASKLGYVANAPIRLVAEKSRIRVSLHNRPEDLIGIAPVRCPP